MFTCGDLDVETKSIVVCRGILGPEKSGGNATVSVPEVETVPDNANDDFTHNDGAISVIELLSLDEDADVATSWIDEVSEPVTAAGVVSKAELFERRLNVRDYNVYQRTKPTTAAVCSLVNVNRPLGCLTAPRHMQCFCSKLNQN